MPAPYDHSILLRCNHSITALVRIQLYNDCLCGSVTCYRTADGKEYWFPFAGRKDCGKGDLLGVGGGSQYQTSTNINTTVAVEMMAWGNPTSETGLNRPYGNSVRCIKEK